MRNLSTPPTKRRPCTVSLLGRKYLSHEYEILLTLDPNYKKYDLFKIRRSHLGNPGVVVGSEARFLLQDMNLAFHLRHLVV